LAQDGAHLALAGTDAESLEKIAATLPAASTRIAGGDPVGAAIAAFGGVDLFVALDVVPEAELDRLRTALAPQGIGGAIVGLERPDGATVAVDGSRDAGLRVNLARVAAGTDPRAVAEVVAFLASAPVDGAVVPVDA
jgi:NADP-dependent 3-hydroxy acid dehydrogenase YdfG